MGNPFDLRGPEFLLFYTVLGLIVTTVVLAMRRRFEPQPHGAGPLTDYLKIAYLRGGSAEAIRVAALALMDRGLLERIDAHHLKATSTTVPAGLLRTEERLLQACQEPVRASGLLADSTLNVAAATECEPPLVRAGLLPDDEIRSKWAGLRTIALLLLGIVATLKIAIALSRGRSNVAFLLILSALFGFVIYRVTSPFRTAAGNAMLDDLRTLFAALKTRAATLRSGAGGAGTEMALLAAVFGTAALPAGVALDTVFRKPVQQSSSSCGSSGSSCGSSCGGGGCGGGCGGCGS
jgi:uncharacterized protein (TIGR04222 family)